MARRIFGWLLRLFPADFRGDFGADMQEVFADERLEAGSRRARARVWARNVVAFLRLGPRLHAEQTWQDARYALRTFRHSPLSTAMAVLALGLAIGASTVTFSVADAFFFKPLPFGDPDRLVHVWAADRQRGQDELRTSRQEYEAVASRTDLFSGVAFFNYTSEEVTGGAAPERIPSARVSANVFDVLGVRPLAGRTFQPGDDRPGTVPQVIVSQRYWQTRMGGRRDLLEQRVEISGRAHAIVGVMPASFVFPLPITDLWVTRALDPATFTPAVQSLQIVARLAPGVSEADAAQALAATSADLAARFPANATRTTHIVPLRQALNFAYDIFLIGAIVVSAANLIVLLTAAANVSSLLIGRAVQRGREVSLRAAIGASPVRLVRQFLVESLMIGLAGGAAGVLLARWAVGILGGVIPPDLFKVDAFAVDLRALGVSCVLAVASALLFGLLPSLRFARVDLGQAMRQEGAGITDRRSLRFQQALVVMQIAISLGLAAATLLVARSAAALSSVDRGFDASGVLSIQTVLPAARYPQREAVAVFQDAVLSRAAVVPGVSAAAFVNFLPLNHESTDRRFERPGTPTPRDRRPAAWELVVTPGYFDVLRIRLLSGRTFTTDDRAGRPPAVIVNETMARRHWSGRSPVGSTIQLEGATTPHTVVGVVADSRQADLAGAAREQIFLAQAQQPAHYVRLLVRTTADPRAAIAPLAAAIHAVDARLPLTEIQPLAQVVDDFLLPQRGLRTTLLVLGGLSVALAIFGVYGIVACFVSERTREIGIRMALGADRVQIAAHVLGRSGRLALRGLAIGLPLTLLASWGMRGMLHGVSPTDPVAIGLVAVGIGAVTVAAALPSAVRAARVTPLSAMRSH